MEVTTKPQTFPFDERTAKGLAQLIDSTGFGVVKMYYREPRSEIKDVVIVKEGFKIEDVAACFIRRPRNFPTLHILADLFMQGVILYGVEDESKIRKELKGRTLRLDSVADDALCYVLYVPPIYFAKLTDKKWR